MAVPLPYQQVGWQPGIGGWPAQTQTSGNLQGWVTQPQTSGNLQGWVTPPQTASAQPQVVYVSSQQWGSPPQTAFHQTAPQQWTSPPQTAFQQQPQQWGSTQQLGWSHQQPSLWSSQSASNMVQESDIVKAFMQQLGMHPDEEETFGWIAELGLQSPLPPSWDSLTDDQTGCTYFVNNDTQATSWENPLTASLKRVLDIGRRYLDQPSNNYFEEQKDILWGDLKEDLEAWHGPFEDQAGRPFFVNSHTSKASATDPRIEAQYLFELQESFLTTLEEILTPAEPEEPDTPGRHWRDGNFHTTDNGAEVLTLDDSQASPASPGQRSPTEDKARLRRLRTIRLNAHVDHKSTLQHMTKALKYIYEVCDEDDEEQRVKISRLMRARIKRQKKASKRQAKSPKSPDPESPMVGRRAPTPINIKDSQGEGFETPDDEEDDMLGDMPQLQPPGLLQPPQGAPSPANWKRPPPSPGSLLSMPEDNLERAPSKVPIPMSPSLRRMQPNKQWAAEAFLASKLSAAGNLATDAAPTQIKPGIWENLSQNLDLEKTLS